jgi:hypothetical protein
LPSRCTRSSPLCGLRGLSPAQSVRCGVRLPPPCMQSLRATGVASPACVLVGVRVLPSKRPLFAGCRPGRAFSRRRSAHVHQHVLACRHVNQQSQGPLLACPAMRLCRQPCGSTRASPPCCYGRPASTVHSHRRQAAPAVRRRQWPWRHPCLTCGSWYAVGDAVRTRTRCCCVHSTLT